MCANQQIAQSLVAMAQDTAEQMVIFGLVDQLKTLRDQIYGPGEPNRREA